MDTKIIGAEHGAAARAKFEAVATFLRERSKTGLHYVSLNAQRVAGYAAGFAQGLVRRGNA